MEATDGQSETGVATAFVATESDLTSTSSTDGPVETTSGSTTNLVSTTAPSGTETSVDPTGCNIIWGNECDTWKQDCPEGQKCNWYGEGGPWGKSKCFPIMEKPAQIGEPCFTVSGPWSGIDNCERGAMCWDAHGDNMALCVALCGGCPGEGTCPPKSSCWMFSEGLSLCFETCDPLEQDCLDPGDICLPSGGYGSGFQCIADASGEGGQVHDACENYNACDPGNMCVESGAALECDQQVAGCCEPFCDLLLPNTCPGAGQECEPFLQDPSRYPNVGYCSLPG